MTAINSTSFINKAKATKINLPYSCDVVDFDNETFTVDVMARSEEEAGQKAASIAQSYGIFVSYVLAYYNGF